MGKDNFFIRVINEIFLTVVIIPLTILFLTISFFINYPIVLFVIACFLPSPYSVIFMLISLILEIINIKIFNKSNLF